MRAVVMLFVIWAAAACGSDTREDTFVRSQSSAVSTNTALFVVGNTTLGAGDAALKARLVALGFTVTVVKDSASLTTDANGKTIVVISSTVTSRNVGSKFTSVAVPVLLWESALLDDMGMTSTTATDFGTAANQTTVQFSALPTDYMTAGYGASPTVTSSAQTFSWGKPGLNAVRVALLATDLSKSVIFRYEKNAQMVGRTAPERRVAFFLEDATASSLTSIGQKLVDAAIRWASHTDQAALGASCTLNSGCASGFCADGMCCNTACTAQCMTCSAGTCGPSPAGLPDGTCPSCNGSGACPGFPASGLQIRYEADAAQIVASNGIISRWKDLSPNHYDLDLGSATFLPSVPSVEVDQYQQMESDLAKLGSFNNGLTLVVMLMAPRAEGAVFFVDMLEFVTAAVYDDKSFGALSVSYATSNLSNGGLYEWFSSANAGPGNWQIIQISQSGFNGVPIENGGELGDTMIHVNGVPHPSTSTVPVPYTGNKQFQMGSIGGTNPMHVRAIFLYNRVLTASERVQLELYLKNRWPSSQGVPSCFDGLLNQNETSIDCGGPNCAACPTCFDGIQNQGETSIDCGGSMCPACITCFDGIMNGDETGVDCGGSKCAPCASCTDHVMNGSETGVDCGGGCPACPTCSDGVQNGSETDVDCGGSCPACPICTDGVKNGTEVGVDCGGPCASCFSEVKGIFSEAGCTLCHSDKYHYGTLSLVTGAWANLVGHASAAIVPTDANQGQCPGRIRVVKSNAGSSLLYQKMMGTAACGTPMPPPKGGTTEAQQGKVASWINAGAINN